MYPNHFAQTHFAPLPLTKKLYLADHRNLLQGVFMEAKQKNNDSTLNQILNLKLFPPQTPLNQETSHQELTRRSQMVFWNFIFF